MNGWNSDGSWHFIFDSASALLTIKPVSALIVMEYALFRPTDHEQRRFDSANRPERRYLTIMFCDLVNSTGLTTEMEPEDLMTLIQAYRHLGTEIISANDGFTASFSGDGIMSIFGYPCAHEDHAERATGSALNLINAVNARKTGPDKGNWNRVSIRIGIASGLVVVGNSGVCNDSPNQIIIGEPSNLAARLQAIAEPDTVIVCSSTRSLIQHAFKLKCIGAPSLRGYKIPQKLWQVTGTVTPQPCTSGAKPLSTLQLVGREREQARLMQLWNLARRRGGRVVLVSGETGTGKTRLLEALRTRVAEECPGKSILQCSACDPNDPPHTYLANILDAEGLAHGNLPAVKYLPEKSAAHNPRLIILDDAHRYGIASLALIGKLTTLVQGKPILLAISHRTQFKPPQQWLHQSHVDTIHLEPLNRANAGSLIHCCMGEEQIPAHIISEIIARGDGIPLFLQELTRTALEAQFPAAGTPPAIRSKLKIPDKVWAVLMARLYRQHPPSREAAQIGAVLGRKFSYSLLAKVWPHNRDSLDQALYSLCRSGDLIRTDNAENTRYMFKWVLMREVAYHNTLRRVRDNLHRQIVRMRGQQIPIRNIHHIGEKQ